MQLLERLPGAILGGVGWKPSAFSHAQCAAWPLATSKSKRMFDSNGILTEIIELDGRGFVPGPKESLAMTA